MLAAGACLQGSLTLLRSCSAMPRPSHFARILRRLCEEARKDYQAAGAPFGPSKRAFELWIHYGQLATCN